jgi:hypothetical protein
LSRLSFATQETKYHPNRVTTTCDIASIFYRYAACEYRRVWSRQSQTSEANVVDIPRRPRVPCITVEGQISRLVAVFSYYERPGILFGEQERLGFYGRTA